MSDVSVPCHEPLLPVIGAATLAAVTLAGPPACVHSRSAGRSW